MSDAALTDAVRNGIFQRLGYAFGHVWHYSQQARHLHEQSVEIVVRVIAGDEDGVIITGVDLTACAIRTDTDADAKIWGTITDGLGGTGHTVDFYADAARSSKAGAIATVDDNSTATIVPQSGFTLAGTFTIGPITANVNFVLVVEKWGHARALDEFPGGNTSFPSDAAVRNLIEDQLRSDYSNLVARADAWGSVAAQILTRQISPLIKPTSTAILSELVKPSSVGLVSVTVSGVLEDLRRAMQDNTGGSGVIKTGPATNSTPSGSFAGWAGGRINGTPTTTDRMVPGVIGFACDKTLDARAPTFTATFRPTDRRRPTITSPVKLTVGKTFAWPAIGLASLVVEYAPTVTTPTGAAFSETSADWSVSGLKSSNSNGGIAYGIVNSATVVNFYESSDQRDTDDGSDGLTTQATGVAASTAFTSTDTGSGLVITGKMGGTINVGDTVDVDFNAPQSVQPASFFEVTLAQTVAPSLWQALMRGFDAAKGALGPSYRLHSASTPNVVDSWIRAGFPLNGDYYGDTE